MPYYKKREGGSIIMNKNNRTSSGKDLIYFEDFYIRYEKEKVLNHTYRFRLTGAPPDQAIKSIQINPDQSIAAIKKKVQREYKLNTILAIQFIFKGKILPENLKFGKIGICPKKDIIIVMSTVSGAACDHDTELKLLENQLNNYLFKKSVEADECQILNRLKNLLELGQKILFNPKYYDFWERLITPGVSSISEEEEIGPSDFAPDEIWTYYVCSDCERTSSYQEWNCKRKFNPEFIHTCKLCGKEVCPFCAYELQTHVCMDCEENIQEIFKKFPNIKNSFEKIQITDKDLNKPYYFEEEDYEKIPLEQPEDYYGLAKAYNGEIEQKQTFFEKKWKMQRKLKN